MGKVLHTVQHFYSTFFFLIFVDGTQGHVHAEEILCYQFTSPAELRIFLKL